MILPLDLPDRSFSNAATTSLNLSIWNRTFYGYVLALPVDTEIARVRGAYGYQFPKWLANINLGMDDHNIKADITATNGTPDLTLDVPLPALKTIPSRSLGPFYRHLEDDEITIDLPQPGKVATLPILAQMSSIGVFSWYCICIKPPKSYDVSDMTVTASALADDLDALPTAAIALLVSGRSSQTGEKSVYGYYIPDPEFEIRFSWNTTRPGRELDGGELVFGEKRNGVALVLQQDLKRAIVSHSVSGQHEPVYPATAWRGDWRIEIEVEDIEVWTERQPEYGDKEEEA
ncbi:uncharacterized protein ASPGLDRAFT_25395 [Aspergillus glaucus CBS 516.65]|uniref:Uncharacterized protein n=1 Tax=Aspergillus glaucus CBS 516.65 TaxID=1160497 RepID=A0A1L9VLH5_ASPGL|nr:hypothetical protein ASPGLDRAFT_25395 [Aspergillus glaucus CBS 516.65]OJJ84732.1 hypothetical protein ASPGLDRAFT_25395 [Aspergillus glaucus CBS 516.65]